MTTTPKSPDAGESTCAECGMPGQHKLQCSRRDDPLPMPGEYACSEKCRTPVNCAVCGKRKNPLGRSAPLEMASSLCDWECLGYSEEPHAPHLWPNEPLPGEPINGDDY